jgi:3-deoxy-manno-octulosonate cytidylyltransferase (CMP-KDO synthetase)
MRWLLTSSACLTGTDRVAEVAERVDSEWFINVQGDEPFLDPTGLQIIIRRASDAGPEVDLFNAYAQIESESDFRSATVPKVVTTPDGRLLYISRAPIPTTKSLELVTAKRQIGLYAFRRDALRQFAARDSKTPLESIEDVEILRFLELGFSVQMIEVPESGLAIDTPEDLERARVLLTSLHQS